MEGVWKIVLTVLMNTEEGGLRKKQNISCCGAGYAITLLCFTCYSEEDIITDFTADRKHHL